MTTSGPDPVPVPQSHSLRVEELRIWNLSAEGHMPAVHEQVSIIEVRSEGGLSGYAEAQAHPEALQAFVHDPTIRGAVIGMDACKPSEFWTKIKPVTRWSCRTGVGHVALAAIDTALWDLAGKVAGEPVWKLLGERQNDDLVPYVTIWHGPASYAETLELTLTTIDEALEAGFRAIKVEALPTTVPEPENIRPLVEATRGRIGPDVILILDVGYRWHNYAESASCVRALEEYDLFLLEAPFPPELAIEHRRLAEATSIPIGTGDILTAAVDYLPLLEDDSVRYLQAGAGRTGLSDMCALARAAAARDRDVIPWGWSMTGLMTAANLHFSVCHSNVPLIEYAPASLYPSVLRHRLAFPDPALTDGRFDVPAGQGLGIEVDADLLKELSG